MARPRDSKATYKLHKSNTIQLDQITVNLDKCLGEGGFGKVFEGRHSDGRRVAVKQMKIEGEASRANSAKKELDNFLKLQDHPNLVKFLEYQFAKSSIWLVMEFCDLGNLDKFVLEEKPELKTKLGLMREIAQGLAHMHTQTIPVIHRDIKPANILITSATGKPSAKIADFGLSKFKDPSRTLETYTMCTQGGTKPYMAPEFFKNESYTASVDIFALGLVFLAVLKNITLGKSLIPEADSSAYMPMIPIGMAMCTILNHSGAVEPICRTTAKNSTETSIRELINKMTCVKKDERLTALQVKEVLEKLDGVKEKNEEISSNSGNFSGHYQGACSLSDKMQGIEINENVNRMKEIERKRINGFVLESKWKDDEWWRDVSVCEGEFVVVEDQRMKWLTMDGQSKSEIKCKDLGCAFNVDVCEGEIYVSDIEKRAILVFDRKGKMKRKLCLPERENGGSGDLGLAVDRENKDIYVSSLYTDIVYKFVTESQKFIPWITDGLNLPQYLCVTVDHHLVVSNAESNTVIKYNPQGQCVWRYGSGGSGKGQLNLPLGVCSDLSGHIFIADLWNHRIVVISSDGDHLHDVDIGEKIVYPQAVSFRNQTLVITTDCWNIYVIKVKYS